MPGGGPAGRPGRSTRSWPAASRRAPRGFLADYARLLLPPVLRWPPGTASGWRRTCRTACPPSWTAARTGSCSATSPACGCTPAGSPPPGTGVVAVARLGRRHRRRRRDARQGRLHRAAGPPRRAGDPAGDRTASTRTTPGGRCGPRSTRRTTALRRPPPAAPRRPRRSSPRRGCRTRPSCGCGWPAAATSTCPCRIRCMLPEPGRRGAGGARRRRSAPTSTTATCCATAPPAARRAARRAPRCCTRSRPTGTPTSSPRWPRCSTALEVASGGELALAARRRGAADRLRAGRPRPTTSCAPRSPPARRCTWRARTSCAAWPTSPPTAGRGPGPGRAAGQPRRRQRPGRQPRDDRHADPVRHRRGAAAGASPRSPARVRLVGFHLHAVSNNLDAAAHAAFVARRAATGRSRPPPGSAYRCEYVNVGGGFGVDYAGGGAARPRRAARRAAAAGRRASSSSRAGGSPPTPAGTRPRCSTSSTPTAAGSRCCAAAPTTSGCRPRGATATRSRCCRSTRWPYPFDRPEVRDVEVDAVGELCTPRDVLTRGQRVARLRVGDVLVFARAGAYGWDISHHDFLRHPHPEVLMLGAAPVGRLST